MGHFGGNAWFRNKKQLHICPKMETISDGDVSVLESQTWKSSNDSFKIFMAIDFPILYLNSVWTRNSMVFFVYGIFINRILTPT